MNDVFSKASIERIKNQPPGRPPTQEELDDRERIANTPPTRLFPTSQAEPDA